ncbi:perilipin-3-like isoform X1 [Bufo gargarizans]|uniref:perilipin-3-like isoform X1 n=1 Tax=Bufo gargarizans TaxID=30331 RepID=UPI001CF46867|nr:perilipin-3-like isoform X1 [Bufo gargarizans]XP_044161204.1 perilipin-3-like isoform X1 [Bufo gargarizans]
MSSDDTNTPVQVAEAAEQQQNVVERVTQLPLVSSACSMVSAVYNSTKDSHPYIRNVCDVAEKGAKTLTDVAVTGSKPILSRLEPQIATANDLACKGLDKLESTLPILQKPTEKVVSDTKELVTGARDAVVGVVTNTVTGTRDTVTSAVSGIMGLAAGAVQGSMGLTRSVVSTVMDTQVGQFVTSSLDTVLGKSEELVDHYLPMTDEELSQLASTVEGFEVAPLQQQKEQQSYYVRLGSLSSRLRHRAYQHSLGKVRSAQINAVETLAQLHQTIDLMETVKQSVHGGQEKLHQLWLEWSRKQSKTESVDGARKDDQPLDSRVLTMTRTLTKQLQTTCFTLVSGAQGLPANIQDRMQQLRQTAQDLHSSFSSVHSFGDISSGILAQSREQASKVHDHVNELLSYVVANTPLTWLVGPFAPQLVEHPEMPEEQPEKVQ